MKKIFVSYITNKGFGNCTLDLDDCESIHEIDDVFELQERINTYYKNKGQDMVGLTIINMIMLPIK